MASFAERLRAAAVDACGLRPDEPLVVAASGGVDSTVLLRSLAALGWPVVAVYVDHGLRAEAADDGRFVEALGAEIGVPYALVRAPVEPGNVQAGARAARYAALADAAREHGAEAVVTGHTATDQAETVLLNLVRGAGLRGLGGMAPVRPITRGAAVRLARPLLGITRGEVEAEAHAQGWAWREDATNDTDRYRRNRIRRHVLPLLEAEGGPQTAARIAQAATAARAARLGPAPAAFLAEHGTDTPTGGRLALAPLDVVGAEGRRLIWADALARWAPAARASTEILDRLDALRKAPVGRRVEAAGVAAWRETDAVHLGPPVSPDPLLKQIEMEAWSVRTPAGEVRARPLDGDPPPGAAVVDADRLPPALVVRPWRDGDRIRPVGLAGSKLVSDLLRERRVPPSGRRAVLVVEGGGEVLWVVGHRLAAAVAAGPDTRRRVAWTWLPGPPGAG